MLLYHLADIEYEQFDLSLTMIDPENINQLRIFSASKENRHSDLLLDAFVVSG